MRTKSSQKIYVGIDNGVSGTIGIIKKEGSIFFKTPTFSEQTYTKKKGNITRIDSPKLKSLLMEYIQTISQVHVIIERPMINPGRWKATMSALRALEATLIIIEEMGLSRMYVDSKEWQKELLPKGCSGPDLKSASADIASRLFPCHAKLIESHGDGDGILMAEYARRFFK